MSPQDSTDRGSMLSRINIYTVLLGVAFMCGTMVLTDTVGKSFKDLFGSVFAGTDAYVRSAAKVSGGNGPGGGRHSPRSSLRLAARPDQKTCGAVGYAMAFTDCASGPVGNDGGTADRRLVGCQRAWLPPRPTA